MVMIMVNIADAKAKLSECVEAAARGETVVICRHNRPVAELRPIAATRPGLRDLTPMFPGETFLTDAFFEPMSTDELAAWDGTGSASASRVAEARAAHGSPRTRRPRKRERS